MWVVTCRTIGKHVGVHGLLGRHLFPVRSAEWAKEQRAHLLPRSWSLCRSSIKGTSTFENWLILEPGQKIDKVSLKYPIVPGSMDMPLLPQKSTASLTILLMGACQRKDLPTGCTEVGII